jgi:hypothetical protein
VEGTIEESTVRLHRSEVRAFNVRELISPGLVLCESAPWALATNESEVSASIVIVVRRVACITKSVVLFRTLDVSSENFTLR